MAAGGAAAGAGAPSDQAEGGGPLPGAQAPRLDRVARARARDVPIATRGVRAAASRRAEGRGRALAHRGARGRMLRCAARAERARRGGVPPADRKADARASARRVRPLCTGRVLAFRAAPPRARARRQPDGRPGSGEGGHKTAARRVGAPHAARAAPPHTHTAPGHASSRRLPPVELLLHPLTRRRCGRSSRSWSTSSSWRGTSPAPRTSGAPSSSTTGTSRACSTRRS